MGNTRKRLSLILLVAAISSCFLVIPPAESTANSLPTIAWQEEYGSQVHYASNLVQTTDGGYVFMDLGYGVTLSFKPSILFKVSSNGTLEWNKTIADFFTGSKIIQTNNTGFEISGWWNAYRFGGNQQTTPTIIDTDPSGNIQLIRNYTTLPNLGGNSSYQTAPFDYHSYGNTTTSDNGFAYWAYGNITKTDSGNRTQWVQPLMYPTIDAYPTYMHPLSLTSVIETSDGSLLALGVGYRCLDNAYTGKIYLVKTNSFLPLPSPSPLPTAIPLSTEVSPVIDSSIFSIASVVCLVMIVLAVVIVSVLLFRRNRKANR